MADKKYKLNFKMSDGSNESVEFIAPQGDKGDVGPAGVYVGTEAPTDGETVWIDTDEEPSEDEGGSAQIDVVANVGQVIAVASVDENSKPTEYKAVDLPKVTTPDYSANEGEDGYIKGRTHYIDEKGIVHKLPNKFIDADWMATSEDYTDVDTIIPEQKVTSTWSNLQYNLQPGIEYDVIINDAVYPCVAWGSGAVQLGNNTSMTKNDYPFCVYWAGGTAKMGMFFYDSDVFSSPIYLKVTEHAYTKYNKLPEEFLPKSVVKSVNGTKPDDEGNVEIEAGGGADIDVVAAVGQTIRVTEVDADGKPTKWESADYQPRTHWSEPVEVLPETTFEVDADIGAALLPDMAISADDNLTVKYNGTEYKCTCADMGDGMLAFGNYGVMVDPENPVDTGEPFAAVKTDSGDGTLVWACVSLDGSATFTLSIEGEVATKIPTKYLDKEGVGNIASAAINGAISEINERQDEQGVEIENIKHLIGYTTIDIDEYGNDPIDAGWITKSTAGTSASLAENKYRALLYISLEIDGIIKLKILKYCNFVSRGSFSSTYFVHPIDTTESNNALAVRVIVYSDKIMYRIDTITL